MGLKKLWKKLRGRPANCVLAGIEPLPARTVSSADVLVTCNEITDRHGTGVILNRIFGGSPRLVCVRSTNLYGEHSLDCPQVFMAHDGLSRPESFARVLHALNGNAVRRVVCSPYNPDELVTAIALKELFGAPLCTFVMDDNNIFGHGIPDELMREALEKSSLRLAISPELRDEYERKYRLKFWVLPPVVSAGTVRTDAPVPTVSQLAARTGLLVGSLWSRAWLEQLRETVKRSGLTIHWYGNARAPWLKVSAEQLAKDGIIDCGFLKEAELSGRLAQYPYAIIPSGSLDKTDDRPEIARLSLPTRMPYLLASANMPMIVCGSPQTAAARFLARFGVGETVPYDGEALRQAVEGICDAGRQQALRRRAAAHAPLFSAKGLAGWIWDSLERGEPADERFEHAFTRTEGEIISYLEAPAPKDMWGDFILVYQALRRLKGHGFEPDFVVDVGSSTGVWSDVAKRVFPKARFILLDPLHEQYVVMNDWYFRQHPDFECMPVAVSDQPGEAELGVSEDMYGSSLLHPADFRVYEPRRVPVCTLDQVSREKRLRGRGLLKVDVQFAEHLVLEGARELLPQVDALLLELSLFRYASQAKVFSEMCELVQGLGFRYYEDTGGWRSPVDGTLLQKDVLFVRRERFVEAAAGPSETADQIRNPKSEIRNKSEIENGEGSKRANQVDFEHSF